MYERATSETLNPKKKHYHTFNGGFTDIV